MDTPSDDMIRDRAYALWAAAGSPDGDGTAFWLAAEQELTAQEQAAKADGEMMYPQTTQTTPSKQPKQPTEH